MKTYRFKHINAEGGVINSYRKVTDIQIIGRDVDIYTADGYEDRVKIRSNQRFEMKRE